MREFGSVFRGRDPEGERPDAWIALTGVIWREGDDWVSLCPDLNVSSFGSSDEEAYDELMDAVCTYLNALEELGERDQVLEERGIPVYRAAPPGSFTPSVSRDLLRKDGAQIRQMEVSVSDRELVAAG